MPDGARPHIKRNDRSVFLYEDPRPPVDQFAQCATCVFFQNPGCLAIGSKDVQAGDSCGLYCHGRPGSEHPAKPFATPQEAGLVHRPVRCENCAYFEKPRTCGEYVRLNRAQPDVFDLDATVHPKGCCNLNTARAQRRARGGALALADGGPADDEPGRGLSDDDLTQRYAPDLQQTSGLSDEDLTRMHAPKGAVPPPPKPMGPGMGQPEQPGFLERTGTAALGAIHGAADIAKRQHEAVGEAATAPFREALSEDYGAPSGEMPSMAAKAVNAVHRAVNLGMATVPAAIGTVAATFGLDPKAVNEWVNEYAPGLVGVEGAPHPEAERVPSPAKQALDNIKEGKPPATPRQPAAPTAPPAAPAGAPVGAAPPVAPEGAPAGPQPAASVAPPVASPPETPKATLDRIARGEPTPPPTAAPAPVEPGRPGMWPEPTAPEPAAAPEVPDEQWRGPWRHAGGDPGDPATWVPDRRTPDEREAQRREQVARIERENMAGRAMPPPEAEKPAPVAAPAPARAQLPKPRAPEPPVRQEPPSPFGAGPRRPENILEFLGRNGGLSLADERGDLTGMDAHKPIPFSLYRSTTPGPRGKLTRKVGGMSLDEAREKAEEAGYLQPDSDINELLGAIDNNLRGNHVFSDRDMTAADEWREHQDGMRRNPEDEEAMPGFSNVGYAYRDDRRNFRSTRDDFDTFVTRRNYDTDPASYHNSARDYVLDRGRQQGHEFLVSYDHANGSVGHAGSSFAPNFVRFPEDLSERMQRGEAFSIHHNHPSGSPLSSGDMGALAMPGLRWAIAHGGPNAAFSAAKLSDEARIGLHTRDPDGIVAAAEAIRAAHKAGNDAIYGAMSPMIQAGEMSPKAANLLHWELVNRALGNAGLIDYVSSHALPEHPLLQRLQAQANAAVRKAVEERITHGYALPDRPPRTVQPEEGMAIVSGSDAAPAAGRARSAGRGEASAPSAGAARAEPEQGRLPVDQRTQLPPTPQRPLLPGEQGRLLEERRYNDTDETDQGLQRVIPGAERSARQAAEGREAAGRGKLRPTKPQKDADEGLFAPKPQPKLPGFEEERPRYQGRLPVSTPQQRRQNGIIARSVLGKIFSPSTVSKAAEGQAALSREEYGQARRLTQQARAGLEQFRANAPRLSTPEGRQFMDYLEGRSQGAPLADPAMRPVADYIRTLNKNREGAVRQLPGQAQRAFIEDYYAHMWKDPRKAQQQIDIKMGGGAWQGSGRNLKGRTIPTYADGIAMGLEPLHDNIVDGEMAYISNIDRFIATNRVLQRMKASGTAKAFIPGRQPDGWTPLNGALVDKAAPMGDGAVPMKTFAPEDVARVYNNMVGRGVYDTAAGPLYDKLMRAKNGMTAAELSLSPFHAVTMTTEAFYSQIARGLLDVASGHPIRGIGSIASAPAAVGTAYRAGRMGAKEWLSPGSQSPEVARLMQFYTKANMSPIGRGAEQYFTAKKGAYKSLGDFKDAMREAAIDIKSSPLAGPFRQFVQQTGRVLDTTMGPLFDHFIPRLKAGAFMQRMGDWLDQHPAASPEEQQRAANTLADSIDNRFGELNYDNLMWHASMKQAAFLSLRAFGWTIGTWREIGGGAADMARGRLTERAAYVAALGVGTAMINGLISYVSTGKTPTPQDLYAYDTGRKDDRGRPIHGMIPGYAREVTGLTANTAAQGAQQAFKSYGYGKLGSLWSLAYELLTNRDYRDDPIGPPNAGFTTARGRAQLPEFIRRYAVEALSHYVPMNWRQAVGVEDNTRNQAMTPVERALTVRRATFAEEDPEGAARAYKKRVEDMIGPTQRWRNKLKRERRASLPRP
jgi:hypothetical protein